MRSVLRSLHLCMLVLAAVVVKCALQRRRRYYDVLGVSTERRRAK